MTNYWEKQDYLAWGGNRERNKTGGKEKGKKKRTDVGLIGFQEEKSSVLRGANGMREKKKTLKKTNKDLNCPKGIRKKK